MSVIQFEDSQCDLIRSYLDSYLNNELMEETYDEVLRHLEKCHSCSQQIEDRRRITTQLKRAVMQEYAPFALRARVRSDLRRDRRLRFNRLSLVTAVAAVLVMSLATLFALNSARISSPPSATASPIEVSERLLKIGLDDHVHCAIERGLAERRFTPEQMSQNLGPEYAGLVALVKGRIRPDYTVVVGHRCNFQQREFIHLIVRNQNELLSLVITRKNGETFPRGGATAVFQPSGVPIYQTGSEGLQVSGLETQKFLAFVVSNQTRDENAKLASNLAPAVHNFLAQLES